jgi:hypothetical protein
MRVAVRLGIVGALVLGCVAGAMAQNPPSQPAQPGQPGQMAPPAQQGQPGVPGAMQGRGMRQGMRNPDRMAMRAQIEERFGQRIQAELGLNDQQMERLRTAGRANEDRQRETNRREGDLFRAVVEQLRPGVAANQDSLGRMLDGIAALRVQRAQSEQQELRELAQFLNPLQRAQLLLMRRQLMDRINAIRGGDMAPGMGRGMGPEMAPGVRSPNRPPEQPQDF